jgi:hypothetical protein
VWCVVLLIVSLQPHPVPRQLVQANVDLVEPESLAAADVDEEFRKPRDFNVDSYPGFKMQRFMGNLMIVVSNAMLDLRIPGKSRIAVFALTRTENPEMNCDCVLKNSKSGDLKRFPARAYLVPETGNRPFAVIVYWCEAQEIADFVEQEEFSQQIAIIHSEEDDKLSNTDVQWVDVGITPGMISVGDDTLDLESEQKVYLCTAPIRESLYSFYLPHWFEYYKLAGISKIFIYESNVPNQIHDIIKRYQDNSNSDFAVELIPFKLPSCEDINAFTENDREPSSLKCRGRDALVHDHGQLLTQTDCILRSAGSAAWTAIFDFDELLVPPSNASKSWNIMDMIQNEVPKSLQSTKLIEGSKNHVVAAFHFFSYFFKACNERHNEYLNTKSRNEMIDLSKISALASISEQRRTDGVGRRSKLILDPMVVEIMGIHIPYVVLPPRGEATDEEMTEMKNQVELKNSWAVEFEQTSPEIRFRKRINQYKVLNDRIILVHPRETAMIHHVRAKAFSKCGIAGEWRGNWVENRNLYDRVGDLLFDATSLFWKEFDGRS